jgi:CheY-like chemotaxis protein
MSFSDLDGLLGEPRKEGGPRKEGRVHVLVVDDDLQVLKAMRRVLSLFYDVTVASSALDALDALSEAHAAVILDIRMPTHDGFWACDRIRERYPEVPVIFHTAHQSDKKLDAIQAQHKPFAYIFKDGDIDRLLATVAAAVHSRGSS